MPQQTRIVCPACGMSRMASAFHRTDEHAYGTWDEDTAVIQIRDAPGGKATNILVGTGKYRKSPGIGFPIIASYTIEEAKGMDAYAGYVNQITAQLLKALKIFRKNNLVSDEDIESIKKV